ncbi:RT0821/Lpp0805 family surface protein [Aureimonas populi]|uniref:RT0821/Lpp0805 family surface protein n=1 Tax=Aureimonas populi TaxID=1701758 RepID=A0ABW5CNB3_9HYPH|nr:RT0821/Lpp0805 family surface protein [Aureimonas populi]
MISIRPSLFLTLCIAVSGCTVISGQGLEDMVDRSLVTGSIAPPISDPEIDSDGRAVRNAVSAADLSTVEARPLAWANPQTGATGSITAITEERAGGRICRAFTTSRQRFDGIALYAGEACTAGQGEWTLTRFTTND